MRIWVIFLISFLISVNAQAEDVFAGRKKYLPRLSGQFVYCQRIKGFWQVCTSNLNGSGMRCLTNSRVDKRYPDFSPDGKRIAYVTNQGELWIMDEDGKNNRRIPLSISCSEPRFSPEGKKIIFTVLDDVYHGSTKIWEVDLVTLGLKKLVNRAWLQYNPSYSPDGSCVIFTDGPALFGQEIRKLDLKTGDITQLTDNRSYDYDLEAGFLTSGEEIIYSTNEAKGDYEIFKMDKFGRDKINLSNAYGSCERMPIVSKDGEKIFFLSDRSGSFQIWQMNMDGSGAKQITRDKKDKQDFSVYTYSTHNPNDK